MFNDYSKILSDAKYKTKLGERLKILTPKQMSQRLPVAIAHIKSGNKSEKLLNRIRQNIRSLYQATKSY